jgi:hypothetical protein
MCIGRDRFNKCLNLVPVEQILDKKTVGPVLNSRLPIFWQIITCQNGDLDTWEVCFYFLGDFKTVDSGQAYIHKDKLEENLFNFSQGLLTISCLLNGQRGEMVKKTLLEFFSKKTIVLYEQYIYHFRVSMALIRIEYNIWQKKTLIYSTMIPSFLVKQI